MNAERTVFAQILDHLPRYEFNKCVKRYNGNHRVRRFLCYDQFLCIAFAQLTYRESLRDIETCLNSHHEKLCIPLVRNELPFSGLMCRHLNFLKFSCFLDNK